MNTVSNSNRKVVLFCWLVGGLLLWAGCWSQQVSRAPSRTVLELPVRLKLAGRPDKMPLIEASVNQDRARLFAIDSGTSRLVLAGKFVGESRPQALPITCIMDTPAGPRNLGSFARVELLRIGSASFQCINACVADLSNQESALGHELGGVIGMGVFADCQITFDYPRNEFLIEPPSGTRWSEKTEGAMVLPLRLMERELPFIPLRVHGVTMWALIDSGYDGAFSMSGDVVQSLHLGTPVRVPSYIATFHGSIPGHAFRLPDSIYLGSREFMTPVAYVQPGSPSIGHKALRHFAVTIDLKNKQVRFARSDQSPIGPAPSIRHWGFYFERRKDNWLVIRPIEATHMDRLGLMANDQVIAVNGTATSALSLENMQHLADTNDVLHLDIIRDGQKMSVDVPVTVIVR